MKIQFLFAATWALTLSLPAYAEDCRALRASNPNDTMLVALNDINQTGQYCLEGNVKAPRVGGTFGERNSPYKAMLDVRASNVVVDLHGFAIDVIPAGMQGIGSGYWRDPRAQQRITVRNGAINSRGTAISFGTPKGSLLADFEALLGASRTQKQPLLVGAAEHAFDELLKTLPERADAYQNTGHLVEKLKIAVHGAGEACINCTAIGMKGAGNVIRNSSIEVNNGHAAIYLFGPNQIIENNIIVFKGRAALASAAAIKLHQGDGTVIRNNDIIILSAGGEAPQAAIALIDSKNVLVEGNRIYGINTLTRAWDERSSAIDRNNDFRSLLRRPWASGEPGVH